MFATATVPGSPLGSPRVQRASPVDLMELASDTAGSPMQVAAVLVLEAETPPPELSAVRAAMADRIRAVPRLRQRLVSAPFGCGRPYWVDDALFDINHHVTGVRCPPPGDEQALLDVTAMLLATRLPDDRPLWSLTYVTGLTGGRGACILVFHHVLSDGIGGLAVLAHLVDGAPPAPSSTEPRPAPSARRLFRDALIARLRAITGLPGYLRAIRQGAAELKPAMRVRAPHCSLNRPIGAQRRLALARVDLAALRATAHAEHATVNDVALTAITGALSRLLRERDEVVDHVVVSVPVSARQATVATQLGNEVGVLPVDLPAIGDRRWRLRATAARTRRAKTTAPGTSAALLAPAFRTLARLGLLRWYVNRQRRVTTFVTNLRGPDSHLSLLGRRVVDAVAVGSITGNVSVSFAVLSYAGTVAVTIVADRQWWPDLSTLAQCLQDELDALVSAGSGGR